MLSVEKLSVENVETAEDVEDGEDRSDPSGFAASLLSRVFFLAVSSTMAGRLSLSPMIALPLGCWAVGNNGPWDGQTLNWLGRIS